MGRTVWFPGHMARGSRKLLELVRDLDLFLEVRDARAPLLTASPFVESLRSARPVWQVLTRRDLADESVTSRWIDWFRSRGDEAWAYDLRKDRLDDLIRALGARRPAHRELRLAVLGIPNVGKSLLLNGLVGRKSALVGALPGITRGVSWSKGRGFLVVDSPGIADPHAGASVHRHLAWIGCSRAEVIGGTDVLALGLIGALRSRGLWRLVEESWQVADDGGSDEALLEAIGRRLGCLARGGGVNLAQAGKRLLDVFATGRLGRVSLEEPGEASSWEESD